MDRRQHKVELLPGRRSDMKSYGYPLMTAVSLVLLAIIGMNGCGGGGAGDNSGLANVGGGIVLTSSTKTLSPDGVSSAVITAVLTDSGGVPVAIGTGVSFSTTLGHFSNGSNTYSANISNTTGTLTVSLIAGTTTGIATVTCTCKGLTQSIQINIGNPAAASMVLSVTPGPTMPTGPTSSVTVQACLTDINGNAVAAGVPVEFTTTLGFFANGSQTFTGVTESTPSGCVSIPLYAGNVAGIAKITCTSNFVFRMLYIDITNGIPGPAAAINLTANPNSIPADGISVSTITAVVTDQYGIALAAGTPIQFTTTLGTFSSGTNTMTAFSGANGSVSVFLFSGKTQGTATVTASSGTASSQVKVSFTYGTPGSSAQVTLTANPPTVPADGASYSTITATITDSYGKPVAAGTIAVFTATTLGTLTNGLTTDEVTTNAQGIATVQLFDPDKSVGTATVVCTSGGVSGYIYVTFTSVTPGAVSKITVTAASTSITADGVSSTVVTAVLTDQNGNPVAAGTAAQFTTTLGTFSNASTTYKTTTDGTGTATATLYAGTVAGIATVTCTSGTISGYVSIKFVSGTPGVVANISLSAGSTSMNADGTSFTTITAVLTDGVGLAVPNGTTVTFTTNLGTFSNATKTYITTTTSSGSGGAASATATATLFAGLTPGQATVSCASGTVVSKIYIQINSL